MISTSGEAYFAGGAPWLVKKLVVPMIRRKVLSGLVARDFLRAGEKALWDDYRRVLDCLEARAPRGGFWLGGEHASVADIAIFGQLHGLRTPLTRAQARELTLRPALTDWLDRVDEATFPGRSTVRLTADSGRDMTPAECRSPIPIRARA